MEPIRGRVVAGIDVFTEWKSLFVDYSGYLEIALIVRELYRFAL